jgi:hypothetical protein
MKKTLLRLLKILGSLSLICILVWNAWDYVGPQKSEISEARQEVAEQALPEMLKAIHGARGEIRSVVMLHLKDDSSDFVTDRLRESIQRSGILDLHDRTLTEKVRDALDLRHPSHNSTSNALEAAAARGADAALFGVVHTFESLNGEASFDVELSLVDRRTGALAMDRQRFTSQRTPGFLSGAIVPDKIIPVGASRRLIGWALLVLLLPVFTISFVRGTVRKGSNMSNASALSVYTGIDALLASMMLGTDWSSLLSLLFFAVALGAAFAYNVWIMTAVVRIEGQE